MSPENSLDDLDLRLIHAVKLAPRAAWSALAPVIGVDAATLARRWAKLTERGQVYVTGYGTLGTPFTVAVAEVQCKPGRAHEVARQLAQDSEALTINLTAGARDILVTVAAPDLEALSMYVLRDMGGLEDATSVRTTVVTSMMTDALPWTPRALSPAEQARVAALQPAIPVNARRQPLDVERAVIAQLNHDGRAPIATIARRTGFSQKRVHDAIAGLQSAGLLSVRVDVARTLTAWPHYVWYSFRVPAERATAVAEALTNVEEVRSVLFTLGESNIMISAWLRTLADAQRFEVMVSTRIPDLVVIDRSLVIGSVKHYGHILTGTGFATGQTIPHRLPEPLDG